MITVCGEVVVDLVPQSDGDYRAFPGGSPANVAVALARLGQPTSLLARLGPDMLARRVRDHLSTNGVGLEAVVDAAEPATLAVVALDAQGRATYDFWLRGAADWQWTDAELAPHPGADCAALHTGSLASWTGPGDRAIAAMLRRTRQQDACTLSFDPNVRPDLLGDPEVARPVVESLVATAHVVKASDEDLAWLWPGRDATDVAREWAATGPGLVVVTLGAEGALAVRPGDDEVVRRAAPTVAVVDTVGAGDTFTAGLLHGLAGLGALGASPLVRLATLSAADLAGVVDLACRAAALTCTRAGCDPPSAAELAAADIP
jgi:fructokinase